MTSCVGAASEFQVVRHCDDKKRLNVVQNGLRMLGSYDGKTSNECDSCLRQAMSAWSSEKNYNYTVCADISWAALATQH